MDMMRKKPELLSPAGDMEKLKMAVAYGADAVYLAGTSFGMRSFAGNFSPEELPCAVAYAHDHGVRVHVTVNTMPRSGEVDALPAHLERLNDAGVDALILADLGAFTLAGKYAPRCERHISTQQSIANYACAQAWYDLGAKRVVLARELSLEEIAEIRAKTSPDLDIEVFVHGAMCVSVSGRCLLSNYLTARDANRGECAQPCRWAYHLVEEKRPNQFFPIFEDEKGTHILNAKDLCMIEHIDKLVKAGVTSLKIEGRAKSSYYVSVVTNAYRCAVDSFMKNPARYHPEQWILDEVTKVSHRQYSTGFFFGPPENGQYYLNGGYLRNYDVVATAESYQDGLLTVTQKNKFAVGDLLEVLEPSKPPFSLKVGAIYEDTGEAVEAACHPLMQVKIPCPQGVVRGSILRRQQADE